MTAKTGKASMAKHGLKVKIPYAFAKALGASKTRPFATGKQWALERFLVARHNESFDEGLRVLDGADPKNTAHCPSIYEQVGADIGSLVASKQAAYGNSFGKAGAVMRILYPDGIPSEKMDDALTVVRIIDKLFRVATSRDAMGEDPWRDCCGYSLLAAVRRDGEKARREAKA